MNILSVVTSPLVSLVILVLGSQFFQTFITIYLSNNRYSEIEIGLIHTSSYLGLLISALKSEEIIKRIGHIRAFAMFSSIIASTILLQYLYVNIWYWIVIRFFSGVSLAALYIAIESWILTESTVQNRGKNLAIYMIVLYISQSLSNQIFNLIDVNKSGSMHVPFIISALLCTLAIVPVCLTYKPNPNMTEMPKLKIIEVFNINKYGFIGCLVSGLILSGFYSFIPKYIVDNNFSVAWMMSALIFGGFALQWPLGKLSDVFHREKLITILSFAAIIPIMLLVIMPKTNFCYAYIFLLGGITFVLYPISISAVCDLIKNKCIIQITGVLLFSYGIGSVLGPVLASYFIKVLAKSSAIFIYSATILFLYGAFGLYYWFIKGMHKPTEEYAVDFVSVPVQTPLGTQLDPRLDLEEEKGDLKEAINEESEEILSGKIDVKQED